MGTHPIFESDFDCLTVYFQTPVGCEYEPREAESSAIVCPSRRQRYRPKEEEDRAQGVFYRRQEAPEPAQATPNANTFAISGNAQVKQISEMLPPIVSQMGPEGFASLRKMAMQGAEAEAAKKDDVPELEGDFEEE